MSTEVEQSILEKIKALPPEQQREVLNFIEQLEAQDKANPKTIWEEIREISDSAPEGTWDNVPTDGSINVDHYLYGAPKKQS
ncbi:MAG: DUF2281 domain-containing protein [Pyrinomonadaceae bacterium]